MRKEGADACRIVLRIERRIFASPNPIAAIHGASPTPSAAPHNAANCFHHKIGIIENQLSIDTENRPQRRGPLRR